MTKANDFLSAIRELEHEWSSDVNDWLEAQGKSDVRSLVRSLGFVLSSMDGIPTCRWGCEDTTEDHLERHLVANTISNARAAIRLLYSGYLAEALGITRVMEEYADLMCLFVISESALTDYRGSGKRARGKRFQASKVRQAIEKASLEGIDLPGYATASKNLYGLLSQWVVHPAITNSLPCYFSRSFVTGPDSGKVSTLDAESTVFLTALTWVGVMLVTTLCFAERLLPNHEQKAIANKACHELNGVVAGIIEAMQRNSIETTPP